MVERRNDLRIVSTFKSAYVQSATGLHFVTLRNISETGVCFDAYPGVSVGDQVEFCFDVAGPCSGTVKWVENGRCGINAPIGSVMAQLLDKQLSPRSIRLPLRLKASLFVEGCRREATIHNLSIRGACIDQVRGLRVGQLVSLEVRGRSFELACVRWSDAGRAGICFAQPLPRNEFRQLVGELQRHVRHPALSPA